MLEEAEPLLDERNELLLVFDRLDVKDVGAGDEAIGLARGEHDGLDGRIAVDLVVPQSHGLVSEELVDGVVLLVGIVEPDDGNAFGGEFDVLEVLILALGRWVEGRGGRFLSFIRFVVGNSSGRRREPTTTAGAERLARGA